MAPRKSKSGGIKKTPSNTNNIMKPKKAARSAKQPDTYRMKRYKNGILNLEKTPAHLIAAVKANAESPLLRLPPEIRNRIWSFACGGKLVMLPKTWGTAERGGAVQSPRDNILTNASTPQGHQRTPSRAVSAFHLPEVCRQVYAETALTSYRENSFVCDTIYIKRKHSMSRLMIAQRRAITTLEMDPEAFLVMLLRYERLTSKYLRDVLPNVRSLTVSLSALRGVYKTVPVPQVISDMNARVMGFYERKQWLDYLFHIGDDLEDSGIELLYVK